MKISNIFAALAAVAALLPAASIAESERVSLKPLASRVVETPFDIESYSSSAPDVASASEAGPRKIAITARKAGTAEINVNGSGGESRGYTVSVLSEASVAYRKIKADLEDIPEVDVQLVEDEIYLRGEVADIGRWEKFRVRVKDYEGGVKSRVTFRPRPEALQSLKDELVAKGYSIADGARPSEPGEIALAFNSQGSALTVAGEVYSAADQAIISQVLSTREWLEAKPQKDDAPQSGKIKLFYNVSVKSEMLDVGAVWVGVSQNEAASIGTDVTRYPFQLVGEASTLFNMLRGGGATHSATIKAGLSPVVNFLAENGVSRFKTAGRLTFSSNGGEAKLTEGGADYVPVAGGDSSSLEKIEYGLEMSVSGGMIGANRVRMEVTLVNSQPPEAHGGVLRQGGKSSVKTTIECDLDETVVLGGTKVIYENDTGPAGVPYLRNVPVLNWFVSSRTEMRKDMNLLILLSPRLLSKGAADIRVPEINVGKQVSDEAPAQPQRRKMRFCLPWLF